MAGINFTRPAAQRIADVVRAYEEGSRDGAPWDPGQRFQAAGGLGLKVATFTGDWSVGTYKVVTLNGSTQTASVYNWTTPVKGGDTASSTDTRYVIFGKASGTNSAVEIQMGGTCVLAFGGVDLTQLEGYDAESIQLLGHNSTGPCLQWYSIVDCSTASE